MWHDRVVVVDVTNCNRYSVVSPHVDYFVLQSALEKLDKNVVGPSFFQSILSLIAGSGQCDRFCSNISVLAGLPMMP
jgi:hypothetical protein